MTFLARGLNKGRQNICWSIDMKEKNEVTIQVSPIWIDFIEFCQKLKYGELEQLKIKDGIPVSAKRAFEHIRFGKNMHAERK